MPNNQNELPLEGTQQVETKIENPIEKKLDAVLDLNKSYLDKIQKLESQLKSTQQSKVDVKATKEIEDTIDIDKIIKKDEAREQKEKAYYERVLEEANQLNEINDLAIKALGSNYSKEYIEAQAKKEGKNISIKGIIESQSRAFVKRYIEPHKLRAYADIEDVNRISGELLTRLVKIAKVEYENMIQNQNNNEINALKNKDTYQNTDLFRVLKTEYPLLTKQEGRMALSDYYHGMFLKHHNALPKGSV